MSRWGLWSRRWDSNPRPSVYETDALPLSYFGTRAEGGYQRASGHATEPAWPSVLCFSID
jgi:hypothetical protein